jgi:beta-galactosidase
LDQSGGEPAAFFYFDHYTNPHYHGAIKSTDMRAWQDISPSLTFPKGLRHGTVSPVPKGDLESI